MADALDTGDGERGEAEPSGIVRVEFSGAEEEPASFADDTAAARAGCVPVRFAAPAEDESRGGGEEHCVLAFGGVGRDEVRALVYEKARSGAFARRHAISRADRYGVGRVSLAEAFSGGRQLLAVTYRSISGTGIGETTYELLGWRGGKLRTVFKLPISCFLSNGGYDIEHHFEPSLHAPEGQGDDTCFPPTVLELAHVYTASFENSILTHAFELQAPEHLEGSWRDLYEWRCTSFSFAKVERHPRFTKSLLSLRSSLLESCRDWPAVP